MKDNERIQANGRVLSEGEIQDISDWSYEGFDRNGESAEEHIRTLQDDYVDLIATIRDRDKMIATLDETIRCYVQGFNRVEQQNTLMLSALEWYGGEQYGDVQFSPPLLEIPILYDCGKHARDTIAQVKGGST